MVVVFFNCCCCYLCCWSQKSIPLKSGQNWAPNSWNIAVDADVVVVVVAVVAVVAVVLVLVLAAAVDPRNLPSKFG